MTQAILAVIGSLLTIFIGAWAYLKRKNDYRREQADKAKEDLELAKKNDSPSDFIDGFGRL